VYGQDVFDPGARADCRPFCASPGASYRALTEAEACAQARTAMANQYPNPAESPWATATCERIKQEVCNNPTLFTGNDPIRLALCGTITPTCPAGQYWDGTRCVSISQPAPPDNTLMYVGLAGILAVTLLGLLLRPTKKVIVGGVA